MDEDVGRKGKFARCIVCSDYSIRKQCVNIFNTTLENGKVLLSEFLKNVLDCSVLIVVSPEFFVCQRCFTLCHNLDCSFTRCNALKGKIRTLFRNSERKIKMRHDGEIPEEDLNSGVYLEDDLKEEIKEEPYLDETEQELYEEQEPVEFYEDELIHFEKVDEVEGMDPEFFLTTEVVESEFVESEVVESEVVVGNTDNLPLELFCDDETATAIEFEQQQSQAVRSNGLLQQENESQGDMLVCEWCGLCFENKRLLKSHKNSENCSKEANPKVKSVYEFQNFTVKLKKKKKVYFCNRCTYETTSSTDISKHLKSHQTEPEYMCDICGRRFKFLKTFNRHQQVHDESRPFACKSCPFRAMTELLLRIHQRQHDDQKKYSCSKCGYKTLKKMSYLIHCRTHTGERPYCCPSCPYKAKDPSTLERHRRIHGGIRRYQCTLCDYKSVQKAALTVHMKTHTGEKPYACEHCDYRSSAKHNLKAHIAAIHSEEKPFACTECTYKTKLKRLLTHHMRKHTGEKPYPCPYCDNRFRYRSALSYHLNTKHPVDPQGVAQSYYVLNYCETKKKNFNGEDLVFSDETDSGSENES